MGRLLLAVAAPRSRQSSDSAGSQDRRVQHGLGLKMKMVWAGLVEASLRPTSAFLLGWGRLFMVGDLVPHLPIALGEIANPSSPAAAFMRLGLSPP